MNKEKLYQIYSILRKQNPIHKQISFAFIIMILVILILPLILIASQQTQVYRSRATYYQPTPTSIKNAPTPTNSYTLCYCTRQVCAPGYAYVGTCGNTYIPSSGEVAGVQTKLAQGPPVGGPPPVPPPINATPTGAHPGSGGGPAPRQIPSSTPQPANRCCR